MGKMIRIRCDKCHSEWDLRLGYGMMHGLADRVTGLFPETIVKKLPLEKMRSYETGWTFAYEPAICRGCSSIIAVPVLRLPDENRVFTAPCPDCGGSVDITSENNLADTSCPYCGEKSLIISGTGMWD